MRRGAVLLADGSGLLARQFGRWLFWDGWRAAVVRTAGAAAAGAIAGATVHHAPPLMTLAVAAWCAAAVRAVRAVERQAAAEATFLALLDEAIGPRNGVLLAEVLPLLHAAGTGTETDVSGLRAECVRLGVTVRDSLKVDGKVSVGVHRDDLNAVLAPPPAPSGSPSPAGSCAGEESSYLRVVPISEGVAWSIHTTPDARRREVNDQ